MHQLIPEKAFPIRHRREALFNMEAEMKARPLAFTKRIHVPLQNSMVPTYLEVSVTEDLVKLCGKGLHRDVSVLLAVLSESSSWCKG